jgi:hypothetical protein
VARTVLHDDERGYVIAEGNELTIGSKLDDPPKVRLTSIGTDHGGAGGVVSFNLSRQTGVCYGSQQTEMAMIRVEQASDVRGDASNSKAEFNFLLNDGGTADADMQKPLAFVWNVITRNLLSVLGSRPDTMWAPTGRTFTQQQDDGNFVTYSVDHPFDKSANPVALWSAWTGKL